MKEYTIRKSSEGFWFLLIVNEDGTVNDYRFASKRELNAWMKKARLVK